MGQPVTQTLGNSAMGVACEVIGNENQWVPEQLKGQELEDFNRVWPLLKNRKPYPDRDKDLARLEELKTEASSRFQERRKAVEEAEAWLKQTEDEEKAETEKEKAEEKEHEEVVLGQPKVKPPKKFEPGGFTDKDIYGESDEAMRRFSSSIRSGVRATSMPPVSS